MRYRRFEASREHNAKELRWLAHGAELLVRSEGTQLHHARDAGQVLRAKVLQQWTGVHDLWCHGTRYEAVAGRPVSRPLPASTELPRAARHALGRRRSRAAALPRGHFDRASRTGPSNRWSCELISELVTRLCAEAEAAPKHSPRSAALLAGAAAMGQAAGGAAAPGAFAFMAQGPNFSGGTVRTDACAPSSVLFPVHAKQRCVGASGNSVSRVVGSRGVMGQSSSTAGRGAEGRRSRPARGSAGSAQAAAPPPRQASGGYPG